MLGPWVRARTQQLCDAMTVPKELMANLLLAAGGRGGICAGGGGSTGELTNLSREVTFASKRSPKGHQ